MKSFDSVKVASIFHWLGFVSFSSFTVTALSLVAITLRTLSHFWQLGACLVLWVFVLASPLRAPGHPVTHSVGDPHLSTVITNGVREVRWSNRPKMRRGLRFMGANKLEPMRVGCLLNAPATNGATGDDWSAAQKAVLNNMARASKPWTMSGGTGAGVNAWDKVGSDAIPGRRCNNRAATEWSGDI